MIDYYDLLHVIFIYQITSFDNLAEIFDIGIISCRLEYLHLDHFWTINVMSTGSKACIVYHILNSQ